MNGKMILTAAVMLVYLAFLLPIYIIREEREGLIKAGGSKLALSAAFCAVGMWGIVSQGGDTFSLLVFAGLLCSLIGDYYLIFINEHEKKFLNGIMSFGTAQILYIAALAGRGGFRAWEFIIAAALIAAVVVAKSLLKLSFGRMELPLSVYTVLLIFMAVRAGFNWYSMEGAEISAGLFFTGAVLFLLSDISLGLWKFFRPAPLFRNLVAMCYFTGQIMIAFSVVYR